MNEKDRAKAQIKLIEAKNRLTWVVSHLRLDLPYAGIEIADLKETKKRIMKIHKLFNDPYPPEGPEVTVTKYLMFDNAKILMSLSPGDLHDLNWQFHEGFTAENYTEQSEQLAIHRVNGRGHFFSCAEGKKDLKTYLVPFKRVENGKFYLWALDPIEWPLMKWRLQEDMSRGIIPVMRVASGWNNRQYGYTAWHPKNNIGVKLGSRHLTMTDDIRQLYGDKDTGRIFRGVTYMLVDALRELKHPTGIKDPFIIQGVNEPVIRSDREFFYFQRDLFNRLEKDGLDPTRMAFEKWNSRWIGVKKIDDKVEPGLQDLFPGVKCFYHGQNTLAQALRWHRGEMGKIHNAYPGLTADSDGHEPAYPGQGIVGKNWGLVLRRITSVELFDFLIYDWMHKGGGYQHLSAVSWFESDLPSFESFMKAGVRGMTQEELREWSDMMYAHVGKRDLELDWKLFSYEFEGKRYPLSELMAVKRAMDKIHGSTK